jgi:hypothetical protein
VACLPLALKKRESQESKEINKPKEARQEMRGGKGGKALASNCDGQMMSLFGCNIPAWQSVINGMRTEEPYLDIGRHLEFGRGVVTLSPNLRFRTAAPKPL